MSEKTPSVANVFEVADITYTLTLEANPQGANAKYSDSDIDMPTVAPGTDQSDPQHAEQVVPAGHADFTLDKAPELEGYTFLGWGYSPSDGEICVAAAATGVTVGYGDPVTSAARVDMTLHAKWEPIDYVVNYHGNGKTSGSMDSSNHTYDEAANLAANAYERTGYEFLGWALDQDASEPVYADGANVMNLASEDGAEVDLYAVWAKLNYVVSFETQADDVQNPADKEVAFDEPYGTLPTVDRTGYRFNGWTLDPAGENAVTAETVVATPSNHTLYAQWTPIAYTVVYEKNDGVADGSNVTPATGSTASSTHVYDEAKNLTQNGFARTGYTFIGWNTKADGTGDSYGDGESVVNLTAEDGATVKLYAQWGAKSYVLRYHANGGTGTMADQVVKYDVPTALAKNAFSMPDHSFYGWAVVSDGEVKYIDGQTVVNLLESGVLDLYAVWVQDSHTVYFDYNGGSGSTDSKQFLNGHAYGQLPEYPVHPTVKVGDSAVMTYLFMGWYTEKNGGTRVYPETIADRTDDHTLYAHWQDAPSNNVIQNIVVRNNPDDNKDGVVDDLHLELTCTSTFEKYNIPLKNLIPGQTYRLTYTASNDASFGDYVKGYQYSVYGSYILASSALTGGRIEDNYEEDEYVDQVLATWNSRVEPDGVNDGSQAASNDSLLQGPWKNKEIVFTATNSTMYWTWDFGLMQDNIQNNYNMTDIVLEPVAPKIEFGSKVVLPDTSPAKVINDSSSSYATKFTFDGESGCEVMYYRITGLTKDATYTITFDHAVTGGLINAASYDYGCGVSSVVPAKSGSRMADLGASWISTTQPVFTQLDKTESVTLTFKATGSTAYWVWNMANCSDTTNCTIDVKVTKFSVKHAGGGTVTFR